MKRRVALALALTSCSWLTVTAPPAPPQPPADCTTSGIAPGLDAAMVAIGVLGAVVGGALLYGGATHKCTPGVDQNCEGYGAEAGLGFLLVVPSAAIAVTYGFSAHYGFKHVEDCRARKRE